MVKLKYYNLRQTKKPEAFGHAVRLSRDGSLSMITGRPEDLAQYSASVKRGRLVLPENSKHTATQINQREAFGLKTDETAWNYFRMDMGASI